ncbi:MAG: hypothetical protein GWO20_05910 [Candidatus Korarchaeota archaeon]|nr:hypothetical protein [Candidatus Korarchaeota archaeon]NIW51513.1 hypothetical protein [Candidatus Korarchaeota archaeon]
MEGHEYANESDRISRCPPFPKPRCYCKKCKKAREKGIPYERICSSLFIYPNILIDTPEGVFRRLDRFKIKKLEHVFCTHWHPDHTQGHRIFEMWVRAGHLGGEQKPPIRVYFPTGMLQDFNEHLPSFSFYETHKFIEIVQVRDREELPFGNLTITPVSLQREDRVRYSFLIKENNRKVMYAPCSVFNAKFDQYWENLDILFLETG